VHNKKFFGRFAPDRCPPLPTVFIDRRLNSVRLSFFRLCIESRRQNDDENVAAAAAVVDVTVRLCAKRRAFYRRIHRK